MRAFREHCNDNILYIDSCLVVCNWETISLMTYSLLRDFFWGIGNLEQALCFCDELVSTFLDPFADYKCR